MARQKWEIVMDNCIEKKIPYVIIRKYGKYADVVYDMFPCKTLINKEGINLIENIFYKIVKQYKWRAWVNGVPRPCPIFVNADSGSYSKMPMRFVEQCFKEISNIINDEKYHEPETINKNFIFK